MRELHVEAGRWFYDAALRGRVGSLILKGLVDTQLKRNAVDLGWVSAADYEHMDDAARLALEPAVVYVAAFTQLAPGLAIDEFMNLTDRYETEASLLAQHKVVETYHRDLAARGLPRPAVLDAALPAFRKAADAMCR